MSKLQDFFITVFIYCASAILGLILAYTFSMLVIMFMVSDTCNSHGYEATVNIDLIPYCINQTFGTKRYIPIQDIGAR